MDYLRWGREVDVVVQRPLPRSAAEADGHRELAFSADLTRGTAGGAPVAADGALDERGQLAAAQPRQGARRDDPQQPGARRPRRRRGAVLPVARLAGRGGEVPLGAAPPRRHRHPAVARGRGAVPGARRGRGGGRQPRPQRGRDPLRLRGVVGLRARLPPQHRRALPRPGRGLPPRPVGRRASGSTSSTRAPTCRRTASSWCPPSTSSTTPPSLPWPRPPRPVRPSWSPTSAASSTSTTTSGSAATRARSASCSASAPPSSCPLLERRDGAGGGAGRRRPSPPTSGPRTWSWPVRRRSRTTSTAPPPARPAVTRQRRSATGAAWYVATRLDARRHRPAGRSGWSPRPASRRCPAPPTGVEVTRRVGDDASWLFVINHGDATRPGRPCTASSWSPAATSPVTWSVPAGGVAVVRESGALMLAAQRRSRILAELSRDGTVRVTDLVELLGVSDMTVRRDLVALHREGLLEKVHGGALAVAEPSSSEPGFAAKSVQHRREKEAIAAAAPPSWCTPAWPSRSRQAPPPTPSPSTSPGSPTSPSSPTRSGSPTCCTARVTPPPRSCSPAGSARRPTPWWARSRCRRCAASTSTRSSWACTAWTCGPASARPTCSSPRPTAR